MLRSSFSLPLESGAQRSSLRHLAMTIKPDAAIPNAAKASAAKAGADSRIGALFAASLTHAFRSRLNAVLGSLELVSQTKLNSEQTRFVSTAIDEGRALLYLVNDALDLGRIEAGELHLDDGVLDPVAIAEAALGTMAASFHAHNISATCVIDPMTPVILRGDGLRLRQILVNLLDNARKAVDSGSVSLQVGPHPEDNGGDNSGTRLLFQVTDTGRGVPVGLREHLFEPLLPAGGKADWRMSSLGLGLALCARFVQMMGGKIAYEAKKEGSVFSFDVQFRRAAKFARLADIIAPAKSLRVLLVDSDTARRMAFAAQGRSWGLKTGVLPDGVRARALIANGRDFDLLMVHQDAEGAEIAVKAALGHRVAVLVPVGATPRMALVARGQTVMWLSVPLRSKTLIDALLGKALPPMDMPDVFNAKQQNERAKVLVIEDSEANRMVMQAQLRSLGCAVEAVDNGTDAIRLVAQRRFDLVLTDLALPDMSGLDVAAGIRKFAGDHGTVPIVAVTGGVHPHDRERCLAIGMNGYLTKPLSKKDLIEVLERYVHKTAPAKAVWDAKVLAQMSEDLGADMQTDLLNAFERELSQRLGRIVHEPSAENVAREAHALKSAARTFGANSLGDIAQQLEELCLAAGTASGQTHAWHDQRQQLVQVGRQTLNEVANWLDADAGFVRPFVG